MKRSEEWKWRFSCEIQGLGFVLCFDSYKAAPVSAFGGRWAPSTPKPIFPGLLSPQIKTHHATCPCKLSQKSLSLSWWRASLHWLLFPSNNWSLSGHEASETAIHKDLVFNHIFIHTKKLSNFLHTGSRWPKTLRGFVLQLGFLFFYPVWEGWWGFSAKQPK